MKTPSHILKNPRITEKGAYLAEMGVYVFDVAKDANKMEVAAAILSVYKVTPRMVRMAAVRGKKRLTRGTNRMGMSASGKKAYVYLKEGDKIELA